jgi:Protein of unknown function (DUF1588)/Protein of unknown function (DUF1587)/Protein of unknown function (DUF1585)/Protein of unknown function (DUF1592)/Protein of unknown function (DUF1595)
LSKGGFFGKVMAMSIISRLRRRFWLAGGLMILPALAQAAPDTAGVASFHKDIQPLLKEYCYDCHGDGETNGSIAFDALKSDDQILNHDLWAKVLKNTRAGLMPPRKKARPTPEEQAELEAWVKYSAFGIDAKNPDPGRVTVRRLNRVEYRNTIHDLMGVDYNTDVEFPPDDTGYGFDDIGDVLTVSPLLLEKYLTAARAIVEEAVPTVPWVVPLKTIDGSKFQSANSGAHATTGPRGTMLSLTYYQPALVGTTFHQNSSGDCEVSLQLAVKGTFYFDPGRCRVTFKLDDQELMTKEFAWEDNRTFAPFVFPEKLEAGDHKLSFELKPLTPLDQKVDSLDMRLVSVNIRGPLDEQHRTRPKNYDRFFTKDAPTDADGRRAYAHELLEKFASKAYRRPVDDKTVDRLVGLAESVYGQPGKTFEAGVAYAMEAVLASPRFLFRIEQPETGTTAGGYPLVDEYSLASRLSYFLWSTMPDDELMGLVQHGELRKNLAGQVKRMLADSRSEAFVDNFTGQWLQTRDVEGANINARVVLARDGVDIPMFRGGAGRRRGAADNNPNAATANNANAASPTNSRPQRTAFQVRKDAESFPPLPQLDSDIKSAMERETQMYFAEIMREDRDVSELIDSDYTYLNQKLANFYGLTNLDVKGQQMRRVTLPPDCARGGILTQGSVLVVTSNPDRTSPVKRGLFIQNSVLGSPPPPPPPNIPALEAAERNVEGHEPTLRETLAMHRDKAECAMCHARLDPIGLAFENFNAMGMWREKERGQTIDPSGQLVTGESFTNAIELKHILATKHRLDFYRCLTEKLLTYATGRGMEYYDTETIDEIVRRLDEQQGHFSALLMGVIESAPFQKERSRANDVFSDAPEPAEKSEAIRANPKGATP